MMRFGHNKFRSCRSVGFARICATLMWGAFAYVVQVRVVTAQIGDPALRGHHPLTQSQAGDVLVAELRCAACHTDVRPAPYSAKTAPDLSDVGGRISPDYLRRYLASPTTVHPGTAMPDVLAARPEAERDALAEALTHFLVSQSKNVFRPEALEKTDRELGKTLFHSVGCVACHGPQADLADTADDQAAEDDEDEDEDEQTKRRKAVKPLAHDLGHVPAKYGAKALAEFLFQPLRVRGSGRMPDLKLTPAESQAIAGYISGGRPQTAQALVPKETLIAKGKQAFEELNCAACHTLDGFKAAPSVVSLKNADVSRGCLSRTDARSPRFSLDDAQVQAIKASLRAEPSIDTDHLIVAKTLTAFNCLACHVRDDFGGVHDAVNRFFLTSEKNLGEDGRIPPPLTLIGAKLQPVWMKKVLFDGESVRPYMSVRMPQFGLPNLGHLPEVFGRLDVLESPKFDLPTVHNATEAQRDREKAMRAAGRELLGDKGLNCVNCHNFNGKPAISNHGIDLNTTTERLQPGWFNQFMRNPGGFRPRIVMPTAWPNGVATYQTILDGKTDEQITAIWYYLTLGTSAADPPGIRSVSTKLTVDDVTQIHRGRSRVAGFRGIAVGLPEKLNYAFNAETGTLTAIWKGDFVGVNWNGQGSGDFQPSADPKSLAQDVSFAQLADEDAPWPLMPKMTKEAPVNQNPLYPKNQGYQFGGYYQDEASVPTFMYKSGPIAIEDRSIAAGSEAGRTLKRVLRFDTPEKQSVWFRALTGDIMKESDRVYRAGGIRLTIPEVEAKLRTSSADEKRQELLLRLQLPAGKSSLEFLYEPLEK